MKERLKKSSPKISGRANLENMNQIKNLVFGKSKSMGIDDEKKEMAKQNAYNKKNKKNKSTATKKGKVDVGLSEALKKQKNKKKPLGMSPGALGGKSKTAPNTNTRKMAVTGKLKKNDALNPIARNTKTKVKATAGNTKDFAKTMAMQKRLIAKGAKIKADGIMGAKTRAAMKKFMSKPSVPTKKTTMVDSFKKSNVSANKNKKAGISEARGDMIPRKIKINKSSNSKLDSKGNYKGTNIKPTKLQLERMKKRRARASST